MSQLEEFNVHARPKLPLQREVPPASQFPYAALPPVLADAAQAMHAIVKSPLALCSMCALGAAHLAAQPHANVEIDGRDVPLSTFLISVGESGERKSATDAIALHAHRERERVLIQQAEDERAADVVGALPPLDGLVLCSEPTAEGLFRSLAQGQPSQGIYSDEGGQFLGGFAMSKDHALKTMASMSNLWDGRSIERVRASGPTQKLYGRRLSLHLMVQPGIVDSLIQNPVAKAQGFLSRCLVVVPESTIGTRMYSPPDECQVEAIKRYHDRMTLLLERVPVVEDPSHAVRRSELKPRLLKLDAGAKEIYIEFHDYVEREMLGSLRDIRAFANKAPEQLLRIAGSLELVTDPDSLIVSVESAAGAQLLVEHFLAEAKRLVDMGQVDPSLSAAARLLKFFESHARPLSIVEVYQRGPSEVRCAETARNIVRILAKHGLVQPARPVLYGSVRQKEVWELTP